MLMDLEKIKSRDSKLSSAKPDHFFKSARKLISALNQRLS
jgi:hypothetical protein